MQTALDSPASLPTQSLEFVLVHRRFLAVLLGLVPVTVAAQAPATDTIATAPAGGSDTIRAVIIQRYDIFDSTEARNWLFRAANSLHITTRQGVVRREILVKPGEPYDSVQVAETARNLRSLGVFRRVTIDSVRTDSGLVLNVATRDGWSTKLDFRFRSIGSQIIFTFGVFESNLLGTATQASVFYRKDPDRSAVLFTFRQPRLIGSKLGLGLLYDDRSDGYLISGAISAPFYSIAQKQGARIDVASQNQRVLQFYDGNPTPLDTVRQVFLRGRFEGARALSSSPRGFTRLGLMAQVRREDYVPYAFEGPVPLTVFGTFGPFLEWKRARYIVVEGIQGFGREEDVDVSSSVRIGANAAPTFFGYNDAQAGVAPFALVHLGHALGHRGFAYIDAAASGMLTVGGLDSGTALGAFTLAWQPRSRLVGVAHVEGGWQKNPPPGSQFDMGGGFGPRAYQLHSFTGDRYFFATADYRYTVADDLWNLLGLGVAAFVDYGGAWYSGDPRRSGWDTGVGIRLGPSRTPDVEPIRIDLAYRFGDDVQPNGFVVIIGKGFPFSLQSRSSFP